MHYLVSQNTRIYYIYLSNVIREITFILAKKGMKKF